MVELYLGLGITLLILYVYGMNIKTTLRISLNINMGYLLFFGISIIVIWGILEYFGVGD